MTNRNLPPLVREISNGDVTWQRLEKLDYETLGYFLSCHLIIEHYIEEHLKIFQPSLSWESARLNFSQKLALMSNFKVSEKYDCIPAIKHLNSLRNKLSHNIEFNITTEHLNPLRTYLAKASHEELEIPSEPKELLELFTSMTCVIFAAQITGMASHTNTKTGA
jgi:hypothetical protein